MPAGTRPAGIDLLSRGPSGKSADPGRFGHGCNLSSTDRSLRRGSTLYPVRSAIALAFLASLLAAGGGSAVAQELEFTDAFMNDMSVIREGRDYFQRQCGHCHGSRAYPGKAPPLRPDRYQPDFVYWVIQGGYGNMPSMGEVFDHEETMKVVAWVKSSYFSQ